MKSKMNQNLDREEKRFVKNRITFSKAFLVAFLLFSTLIAFSHTGPASGTVTGESEKTIRNYFKFPQVLLPKYNTKTIKSNKVEVIFTTDTVGNVNFVLAKTVDKRLKQEIERQFSLLQLKKLKQNVVHSVTLDFRTL